MDVQRFGSARTGELKRITVSPVAHDWAFIPRPLDQAWEMPPSLWPRLAEAREQLARLDGVGRTLPDVELLLRPLQNREAIRSSSLEGTFASPEELMLFELEPSEPTSESDPRNAWLEVMNYGTALREGAKLLSTLPLSLRLIRTMHSELLKGVRGRDRMPGEFRQYQVHVGSDRRYIPPPVEEMHRCLAEFESFLNEPAEIPALVRSYIAHYQFEAIHPFVDGNGRVGRALLALTTSEWCGLARPWLYMSAFFDRYKDEYIDKLFAVSAEGAWEDWIDFCLRGTIEQCLDAITRCDGLRSLKEEFHDRAAANATKRTYTLIEQLFSTPIITVPTVAERFGVTYPTALSDVQKLMDVGVLEPLGTGRRPQPFYSPRILQLAYFD